MFSVANFFYGIAAIGIGIITLKYNYQIVGLTGHPQWIVAKLGQGSTYLVYKLLSILLIVFGLLLALGLADDFFLWLFSPIKNYLPKGF